MRSFIARFALLLAFVLSACLAASGGRHDNGGLSTKASARAASHPGCPVIRKPGWMTCFAQVSDARMPSISTLVGGSPPYTPQQLRQAYSLPSTLTGGPQTVAIIDVGADTHLLADLATFDQQLQLPACTEENGCIRIVNQRGGSPAGLADWGWSIEVALDVESVHGLCPQCRVLLVLADDPRGENLAAAVDEAAALGATEISNSWGGAEAGGATILDASFNHPGIAITASTGDSGWLPSFPADEPSVIAVGGTSLYLNPDGSYSTELAWSKAGSGCSGLLSAPAWQIARADWAATKCGQYRAMADVSALADPNTGAAIYNQPDGWVEAGGTSLAAPIVAAIIALAGGMAGVDQPSSVAYAHSGAFRDVVTGSNGSCVSSICHAGPGYDGPTGIGAVYGIAGFAVTEGMPSQTPTSVFESPTPVPDPPSTTPLPTLSASPTSPPSMSPTAYPSTTSLPPAPSPVPTQTPSPTSSATATPTARPRPSPTPIHRHHRGHCLRWLDGFHSICLWWHRGT